MTPDRIKAALERLVREAALRGEYDDDESAALLKAIEARFSAPVPDDGWQPIETAPKDGTHILVAFGPYNQNWTFAHSPPTVAHWFGPAPLPGLRAGHWYLSVQTYEGPPVAPTHWRPLPAPAPPTVYIEE